MKSNYIEQFNETIVEETLDNGLRVIIYHKPLFASTSAIFATPFGSLDVQQIDENGTIISYPSGIAHFLEHKLFESDEGDIMAKFTGLGASVNAFTSYHETIYYFSTSDQDVEEPLNLLLDFVQNLSISEQSVEKEKGIIDQELNMYLQMPDSRLIFETFKGMYQHHPLRLDIGGDHDSVYATTIDDLYRCYNINYHPSNMMMVISSPIEPTKLLSIIKENQIKKKITPFKPITRTFKQEPKEVAYIEKTIEMDVSTPKTCIGFKLEVKKESSIDRIKRETAIRFSLENHFSANNPQYQQWLDTEEISHYFGFEIDCSSDYAFILFYDETENPTQFKQFIFEQLSVLKTKKIDEYRFSLMKNRAIGETITTFDRPEDLAVQYFRDSRNNYSIFDNLQLLSTLTNDDCLESIQQLTFEHFSQIIINPNETLKNDHLSID